MSELQLMLAIVNSGKSVKSLSILLCLVRKVGEKKLVSATRIATTSIARLLLLRRGGAKIVLTNL